MSGLGGALGAAPQPRIPSRWRVAGLALLVFALFAVLTGQLVRLQIIEHERYADRAAINRVRTLDLPPARGLIYARDGTPLVENVPRHRVLLIAGDVPGEDVERVAGALAAVSGLRAWEIADLVLERKRSIDPFLPIVIEDDPDPDVVLDLQTRLAELPGLEIETTGRRRYEHGELLAHILGYTAPISEAEHEALADQRYRLDDLIGQTGVEAVYERQLRGLPGWRQIEVDALGRELDTLDEQAPADGNGVVLAIDLELQRRVSGILSEYLAESETERASLYAAAAVLDVHTGEVLALVSAPAYDVNLFAEGISSADWRALLENEGKPLRNHATGDQFAPGSIFKLVTALAGLEEGVIDAETSILAPSNRRLIVNNESNPNIEYVFRDTAEGVFQVRTALAESSNTFFYYVAGGSPFRHPDAAPRPEAEQAEVDAHAAAGVIAGDVPFDGVGPDALAKWAREFGLDSPTGVDLVGEAAGLIPTPAEKERTFGEGWLDGDSYLFGIGQGSTAVTPLQMAVVAAAIANGGLVLQPQVVREVLAPSGAVVRGFEPVVVRRMSADPEHLRLIGQGMAMSVLAGTSHDAQLQLPSMMIAGKTGTAEFAPEDIPPRADDAPPVTHGWFVGYAPYDDPKIALSVFFEFGEGFRVAEPAGKILAAWAELSGEIVRAAPPPPARADLSPEETARVTAAVEERSP